MLKVFNNKFISSNFLFLILLILVPISFIAGPFFVNLLSTLFIIIFISLNFKKINFAFFNDKVPIACLGFVVYLILNSVLLNGENASILHTFTFGRFILFAFAIFFFLKKIKNKFQVLSFVYLAISIFVSFDIVFQFIFQKDLFGYTPGMCIYKNSLIVTCERYSGIFGKEYIAGNFLATFGIFSLFFVFENIYKSLFRIIILFLIFFLFFITIILSGERSSLIIFFGIILLNIFINKNIRKYLINIFYVSLFTLALSIIFIPHVKHRLYSWPSQFFYSSNENLNLLKKVSHTPWGALYLSGYEIFTNYPYFGSGYKSFRKICNENKIDEINKKYNLSLSTNIENKSILCSTHPHNIFIEILAEIGIIGLFFFIMMFYYLMIHDLIKNFSKLKKSSIICITFSIILLIMLPIKPTGSISSSIYGTSIWFFLGFYLYFVKDLIKNNEKKNCIYNWNYRSGRFLFSRFFN